MERAQSNQLLVLGLEREGVEHAVKLLCMGDVELRMQKELAEPCAGEARLLDQPLDQGALRVVCLELEVAEDRDRVVIQDPVVLSADAVALLDRIPGSQ